MTPEELATETAAIVASLAKRERERRGLRYVPHNLHAKQHEFLAIQATEALYGGAAGGGKTDALLADALRWVHEPGYAALMLRRTFSALRLPGALLDRAHQWLRSTDAVWSGDKMQFRFPSGAVVQFGYCDSAADLARYQSAEFSRIYCDELTEWPLEQYEFLFSRMRAPRSVRVPKSMRGATNPGGLGGEWVRRRFGIPEDTIVTHRIESDLLLGNGITTRTIFLPARVEDNPSIDLAEYEVSLSKLGPQKYQQLRWGRWVRDGEGLVYYALSSANIIGKMPAEDRERPWSYLLGIDYGFNDPTAFVVLAHRDDDPATYVVESAQHSRLDADLAANETQRYCNRFAFERIVGDTGGAGKAYAEEARRRYSLPIEAAEKTGKIGFIDLLNGALSSKRLLIVESENAELLDSMRQLPWAKNKLKEHGSFDNHTCLVAGTLVETARGPVPIERVRVGDYVSTRVGLRLVQASEKTGHRPTYRLGALEGTADHPVLTQRGMVPLLSIGRSDILCGWENSESLKLWNIADVSTGAIRRLRCATFGSISAVLARTGKAALDSFIATYGRTRLTQSLRVTSSTIMTKIRAITGWLTSSAYLQASTYESTPALRRELRRLGATFTEPSLPHPYGIGPMLAMPGMSSTVGGYGTSSPASRISARCAERLSRQELHGQPYAGRTASLDAGERAAWTTNQGRAPGVSSPFGSAGTQNSGLVPVLAPLITPTGTAKDVYNLTVEGAHEFVANGILVSNCDALLYAWRASSSYAERERDMRPKTREEVIHKEVEDYWARENEKYEQRNSNDGFEHGTYQLDRIYE